MKAQRLEAVRQRLKALRLDALLVTFTPHVRYLTNFSGSNGLVCITPRQQWFFSDGRYRTQSAEEVKGFRRIITGGSLLREMQGRVRFKPGARIGVDTSRMSVVEWKAVRRLFPKARCVSADSLVESLAAVKDGAEVGNIRRAIAISEKVFEKLLKAIKPGMRERELAAEIVSLHRLFGAEADAFEPIVASGERGALPHARASEKKIRRGELITIDFGCRYQGYHSDITRTVALGRISSEQKRLYAAVLEAQERACDRARDGMSGKELDAVARNHLVKQGLGKFFMHSLGHGLGLQVHERPRISALSGDILEAGNVITIEPGVYVPGVGGVRIEDDVLILGGGSEVLTRAKKELITL